MKNGKTNTRFINVTRSYQEYHRLTLRQTAKAIGISPGELSRIWKEIHNPSIYTLLRTAKRIDVPLKTLLPH